MIVQNYYPFAEVRVRREAEALVEQGHSVDVVCRLHGTEPLQESIGGVTVHRLAMGDKKWGLVSQFFDYLAFAFAAFLKVTRLHLRNRFDVVQAHNLPDFLVFSAIVPRLTGSRIILDIHDLMPEFFCSRYKTTLDSFSSQLVRLQESLSCRFADRVITVTDLWKETLINRGVPKNKCFVVMNLADPAYFETSVPDIDESRPDDAFRLIYHGTVAHRYGVDLLLKALALVKQEIPNVHLRIHGRGDFVETVRAIVIQLGLEQQVAITSEFLSPSDLSRLIRSFDLGVVPYRRDVFTDGILPTKLLEYVALGIPAVVAKTRVVSRYFDDNALEFFESENVSDLARHIIRLYRDRERLQQLVSNSSQFNSLYNWPRQKDDYVRFVEQIAFN
jgi:glycosyltransferase involved in cell wall biosynthesis